MEPIYFIHFELFYVQPYKFLHIKYQNNTLHTIHTQRWKTITSTTTPLQLQQQTTTTTTKK